MHFKVKHELFVCMYVCLCINALISISSLASGPLACRPELGCDSLLLRPSAVTMDMAEIHTAVIIILFRIYTVYA